MRTIACVLAFLCLAMPQAGVAAERIISIGGDVTEIIYALGAGDMVVARDSTSRYPGAVNALPDVGYMRQLSAEPILALGPTHIIAIADAGPKAAIDILEQAGVRFTEIPDEPSVAGALAKVRAVAAALGREADGEALAKAMQARIDATVAAIPKSGEKPRAVLLLSVGRGAPVAGGRGTSADAILSLAGGRNVAGAVDGYKPIEPEAMTAADPEVVIVTQRSLDALGGADAILGMAPFIGTSAADNGRLVAIDGAMMLGFGPRLPDAIAAVARALHGPAGE